MTLKSSGVYDELKEELDKCRKLKYNLAIVSIPGMGASRLLKRYAETDSKIKYIRKNGDELGDFSILDLGMDLNSEALNWVEEYFHRAKPNQNLVVAVNTPYIFQSAEYKQSYFRNHIYKAHWLRVLTLGETKEALKSLGAKVDEKTARLIFVESGGLPQLIKYEAIGDRSLIGTVVEPIWRVISKCLDMDLEKMGVMESGQIISKLLVENKITGDDFEKIKIDFDLSFHENGVQNENKLTQVEAEILKKIMINGGQITKEEVSNLKWGEGTYDNFSDQAINKAIRRLSAKLIQYEIKTIPKVGYKIVTQSGK